MSKPDDYGNYYYGVMVTSDVSSNGEIYVMADDVQVTASGALEFVRKPPPDKAGTRVNLIIPAGKWSAVFAASLLDGRPIAAVYWDGQIENDD